MAQYGGGYNSTGGGYGQTNPYEQQGNRYEQNAGNAYPAQHESNPYAQQPAPPQPTYGGQQQQGGYDNRYEQAQAAPTGGYVGGNDVEMTPMNGQTGALGGGAPPSRDPNAILNECRDIDRGIDNIQRNLERLKHLQTKAINDPDASQGTATNRELDSLSADTMTLYRSFTARIKSIKSRKESGEPRNAPQVGLVERKLKKAINEYQQVDSEYRHQLSSQMERQYRIVRPDASEQEVKEAIQDTSNNQVFSQALLSQNRRGQSQSALRAVQGRHEAIQKIERQMIELAQLFQDMEAAVVQQEAPIAHIDDKAEDTVTHVNKGNEQLVGAVDKARSARRKKWICLGIVLLIIIIIVVVVVVVVEILHNQRK